MWPPLTVTIDLIGQYIIVHAQYIHHVLFQTTTFILSQHKTYSSIKVHLFFEKECAKTLIASYKTAIFAGNTIYRYNHTVTYI